MLKLEVPLVPLQQYQLKTSNKLLVIQYIVLTSDEIKKKNCLLMNIRVRAGLSWSKNHDFTMIS